jgi:hypothetical protein
MNNYNDINHMLSNLDLKTSAIQKTDVIPKSDTVTMNTMLRDLDLFTDRNNTFMNRDFSKNEVAVAVDKPDLNERLSSRELLPTSSSYNGNSSRHNIVMESYPLSTRTITKDKNKTQ